MKLNNLIYSKISLVCLIAVLSFFGATNVFAAVKDVPNVTLDTLQGKYTLSEQSGKTLVLFFSFPG